MLLSAAFGMPSQTVLATVRAMNDLPKDAKYFLNLKSPSVLIHDSPPSNPERKLQFLVVWGQCPCQTMKDCKKCARNLNPAFDNKNVSN